MKTLLCELFEKYGSDKTKGTYNGHSYSAEYYNLFKDIQLKVENMLEIGIGNVDIMNPLVPGYKPGASLRAWRDFFINANIYSFDNRNDVLFSEYRIDCFYADQSVEQSLYDAIGEIYKLKNNEFLFDIIIDDGSHVVGHQMHTLLWLTKYLKKDAFYIVEDVRRSENTNFKNLETPGLERLLLYNGLNDWDDFIVYKKL